MGELYRVFGVNNAINVSRVASFNLWSSLHSLKRVFIPSESELLLWFVFMRTKAILVTCVRGGRGSIPSHEASNYNRTRVP